MAQQPATTVAVDKLRAFVAEIFAAAGCDRAEAGCAADHLLSANLAGHDSHGVIRVPRYVLWIKQGFVRPGQKISVVTETPIHAIVDGNGGLGQSIGEQAVDLGISKAKASGVAVIGLRNTGHLGRIGDWGERAAAAGLVSIHFVNVENGELVAPFGGVSRRFSTNPICIAVPTPEGGIPMLLDFATSLVAEGKVLVASNGGKPVPDNALIGPDGKTSGDPRLLYGEIVGTHLRDSAQGEGALRTFGEHKGSGLAFMCDILAGCLLGGGTSGPVPGGKRSRITNGMLSIYLDPNRFGGADFLRRGQDFAAYVKASRPATPGGEVLVAGEPEARTRAQRLKEGIPLQPETWAAMVETARGLGVQAPTI
jgi:uncharacterized oxidoreductase